MSKEPKRKRGRPPGFSPGRVFTIDKHLFLDIETARLLSEISEESGLSESAVVRELIAKYAKGEL